MPHINHTPCKGKSSITMAQSLSKVYIHLIFHIKTTSPAIRTEDINRLHSYIGQIVNTTGSVDIRVGGVEDHVHVLFLLSREMSLSNIIEEIKRNSSRWIKSLAPYYRTFAWQGGYAAFSVSQSIINKTLQYIDRQREHHKKCSFADEYKAFLKLYNVKYDERYVFSD
ncbi:IS200/IS605 family transposase [Leyella stercorea]|uniref:IS200/IS605 family transposase n=1 Tax=Leyella stercorea TaxID=363265 RepID=UPI003AB2329F